MLQQFGCSSNSNNTDGGSSGSNNTTTGEDSGLIADFQIGLEEQRLNLQQKMAMLQDSNNMLLKEKEQLLARLRLQEQTKDQLMDRLQEQTKEQTPLLSDDGAAESRPVTSDAFSLQLEVRGDG